MGIFSIEFSLFFCVFFFLYWSVWRYPRIQNNLILAVSLGLLCWIKFTFLLAVVGFSVFIYFVSVAMDSITLISRKSWLSVGVIGGILNLSFFKYFNFFEVSIQNTLNSIHIALPTQLSSIAFPLGISFYTFQAISYLVSRYRLETEVPRLAFSQVLSYFSFFPTVTSGPIFRAKDAAPQLLTTKHRHIIHPSLAVSLILLGIAKKWWLAGWLKDQWVDPIFANPAQYQSLEILSGIYAYTVQLFLDFSGYSDLVIGMAMLLGFQLLPNFKQPLLAHNIRDFWNRWHISLSTWIRDYIYIPLGGSRGSFTKTQFNLMTAMVLSGIWHGAGWNFVLWGALHGLCLVGLNITDRWFGRDRLASHAKWLSIFLTVQFVCFCFVFFRAASLQDAIILFSALVHNVSNVPWTLNPLYLLSIFLISWLLYPHLTQLKNGLSQLLDKMPRYLWPIPLTMIFIFIVVMSPSGIPGFIYANF